MKKSLLLLVAGAITISASAQYATHSSLLLNPAARNPTKDVAQKITPPSVRGKSTARHSASRTTSITSCSYTETFPSTVLTSGGSGGSSDIWTTSTSGPWHQTTVASTSGDNLGTLASTTASNGWMIFDCDSLRGTSTTDMPAGWLQSPAINCNTLTTVGLSFQELFQGGAHDTCLVEVSTSSTFATYTSYPVYDNNIFTYQRTANPDTVLIDITSAAAGHTVYIRFVYEDLEYWGFSWLIDDVCVGPLSAHDVSLNHQFVYQANNATSPEAFQSSIFETPLEFIDPDDSLVPVAMLNNLSNSAEASVPVNVNITGPGAAYSTTYTYTGLGADAFDSVIGFNGYVPNAVGSYTVAFNAALTTDSDPANNVDTTLFAVSDTTWNDWWGQDISDYAFYVYGTTASTGLSTPLSNFYGARFDVSPNVVGDTVSGFGVAFAGSSALMNSGGTAMVQLYSNTRGGTSWAYQGSSVAHRTTTMEYSTSSTINFAYFPTYTGYGPNAGGNFILAPNTTYAAVVQTDAVTTDLLILVTDVPNATYDFYYPGYFGQSGTSSNDGMATFGGSDATGEPLVPMVQMYFNNIRTQNYHVGVNNVNLENSIGQPFPNPSTSSFTIPVTMAQDATVTVTLMDITGQTMNTQVMNVIGGQGTPFVFNTSDLAAGMYIYTVQANGVNTTGRVVVSH